MRSTTLSAFALVSMLGFVGCAEEPIEDVSSNRPQLSWEEFMSYVYQEPDTGVYIANGDEMFENIDELRELYDAINSGGELIVNVTGGADDRWFDPTQHNITYCVSTTFGAQYTTMVNAMDSATGAWEAVGDINFVHVASEDGNCTSRNGNVVFNVRPVNSGCQYLARAFFPHNSRRNREVLVDTCTFSQGGNPSPTGVMRHELGHTIGFRHEHTRPEAGVCFEDNNWRALTPYDSSSVMHYPQCNGTNSWALNLTSLDGQGCAALYGAPGGGGGGGGGGGHGHGH
jgi:serine protease